MPSLPLNFYWDSLNASWQEEFGWKIPAAFKNAAPVDATAVTDHSHRGTIKVSGCDRMAFLNRMLTNDLNTLKSGQGQRSFLLSAQGKCLADIRVLTASNFLLLDTEPGLAQETLKLLDRFIITDDVQLETFSAEGIHLVFHGKNSLSSRALITSLAPGALLFELPVTASLSGAEELHIFMDAHQAQSAAAMLQTLAIPPCGHEDFERLRIKNKTARFRKDFDETWFLNETGLEETAASETKGCYPGQEVVARMKTYKKDARRLFL